MRYKEGRRTSEECRPSQEAGCEEASYAKEGGGKESSEAKASPTCQLIIAPKITYKEGNRNDTSREATD